MIAGSDLLPLRPFGNWCVICNTTAKRNFIHGIRSVRGIASENTMGSKSFVDKPGKKNDGISQYSVNP